MKEYHKIQTVYKRDPQTNRIVEGDYSLPEFGFLKDCEWTGTEKVDGTNCRIIWDGSTLRLGGKADNSQMPFHLVEKLQSLFTAEKLKTAFNETAVTLYGEGFGPKIQKGGGLYGDSVNFALFDIRIGEWWLERPNVEGIAAQLECEIVPIVYRGTLTNAIQDVRQGFNSKWGTAKSEGLVLKPSCELRTRSGERIITKIKHRDFR